MKPAKAVMHTKFFTSVFFFLSLLVATSVEAQTRKTFNLSNFDRLDLGSAFIIDVKPGNFKVEVEGEQKDLDELEANVSSGQLRIRYREMHWRSNNRQRVHVHITMPALTGVRFSGASQAKVSGFGSQNRMNIDISGASQVSIDTRAKQVQMDLSGASQVTLNGNAESLDGKISGATIFKGEEFKVGQANVNVSGASSARIYVTEKLLADASGASQVRYRGHPSVTANTSGASQVSNE